jgi:acetyl-CoA carboxylase carboxyl transferase subunit alpha
MTSCSDDAVARAWRQVELARHPERPHAHDYIRRLIPDFQELHGDRMTADDPALMAGVGTWHGMTVMCFGQQKGRFQQERVARNFGMMHPEGYR